MFELANVSRPVVFLEDPEHVGAGRLELFETKTALMDAADEDRGTGGFDTNRGIYPTCKLATRAGVEDVSEKEILQAFERVTERVTAA